MSKVSDHSLFSVTNLLSIAISSSFLIVLLRVYTLIYLNMCIFAVKRDTDHHKQGYVKNSIRFRLCKIPFLSKFEDLYQFLFFSIFFDFLFYHSCRKLIGVGVRAQHGQGVQDTWGQGEGEAVILAQWSRHPPRQPEPQANPRPCSLEEGHPHC